MSFPASPRIAHFIFFACLLLFLSPKQATADFIHRALELEKNNDWKTALNYLIQAKDSLDRAHDHDPRIGFEFIRIVTEQNATEFYELATNLYYWGLFTDDIARFKKPLADEVNRIKPIISEERYTTWRSLLEAENPALTNHIRGYWTDRDMTPTQLRNERLLEHWERIAYSRSHFQRNSNTVYGTDDRALIYVKYGPPQRKRTGTFTVNRFKLEHWAESMIIASGQGFQSTGSDTSFASNLSNRIARQDDMKNQLVQLAEQIHEYAEFEVWVYDAITESRSRERSIIYLFGSSPSLGSYGLRRSVDEFVPRRAFTPRRSQFGTTHMNPAILLQLTYYEQLMATDNFFGDRFASLENEAVSTQRRSANMSRIQAQINENGIRDRQRFGPQEFSNYEATIPKLHMNYRLARFLDEDYNPILFAFVYSDPVEFIYTDFALSQEISQHEPDYRLLHNIRSRTSDYNTLAHLNAEPIIELDNDPITQRPVLASSMFIIPFSAEDDQIRAAVQLKDVNRSRELRRNSIFDYSILAVNNMALPTPSKLTLRENEFAVSDLIIGYGGADLMDIEHIEGLEDITIPFYVPYERKIPRSQGLRLMFETYHISPNAQGISEYTVEYQLRNYGLFGRRALRFGATSLRLQFMSPETRTRDVLEIDISDASPGRYKLILRVTDTTSGKTVIREEDVEIVDL